MSTFLFLFVKACVHNFEAGLQYLLDHGASVDVRANDGSTPFHWCCANSHLKFARKLLERDAGIDAQVLPFTFHTRKIISHMI